MKTILLPFKTQQNLSQPQINNKHNLLSSLTTIYLEAASTSTSIENKYSTKQDQAKLLV